jgi:regulator of nucleoside diphosphate kinase
MNAHSLPPVTIVAQDYARLKQLAIAACADNHPVAGFLLAEIRRARVAEERVRPRLAAALNLWVTYHVDDEPAESRILVHPEDYVSSERQLSVLSPKGAALIGLRAGDRMPYRSIGGLSHVVTLESVS